MIELVVIGALVVVAHFILVRWYRRELRRFEKEAHTALEEVLKGCHSDETTINRDINARRGLDKLREMEDK